METVKQILEVEKYLGYVLLGFIALDLIFYYKRYFPFEIRSVESYTHWNYRESSNAFNDWIQLIILAMAAIAFPIFVPFIIAVVFAFWLVLLLYGIILLKRNLQQRLA
jgi:hypothetical protein